MQLQRYSVIDRTYGKQLGILRAKNLWDIYKVIEASAGIPRNQISKYYRVQRVGVHRDE